MQLQQLHIRESIIEKRTVQSSWNGKLLSVIVWLWATVSFLPPLSKAASSSSRPDPEATASDASVQQGASLLLTLSGSDPNGSRKRVIPAVTILPQHGRLFDGPTPSNEIRT